MASNYFIDWINMLNKNYRILDTKDWLITKQQTNNTGRTIKQKKKKEKKKGW